MILWFVLHIPVGGDRDGGRRDDGPDRTDSDWRRPSANDSGPPGGGKQFFYNQADSSRVVFFN